MSAVTCQNASPGSRCVALRTSEPRGSGNESGLCRTRLADHDAIGPEALLEVGDAPRARRGGQRCHVGRDGSPACEAACW